jgi:hypothetical protein
VAARIDRGGPRVSQERINKVLKRYGFAKFLETSATRGDGIKELRESIRSAIAWNHLPRSIAPEHLDKIKSFLRREKQEGRVLIRREELLQKYRRMARLRSKVPEKVFDTCLGLLDAAGLLKRLTFGGLVLIQPEILDAYCMWVVHAAREEPDGLGCILKERALRGDFPMDSESRLRSRASKSAKFS